MVVQTFFCSSRSYPLILLKSVIVFLYLIFFLCNVCPFTLALRGKTQVQSGGVDPNANEEEITTEHIARALGKSRLFSKITSAKEKLWKRTSKAKAIVFPSSSPSSTPSSSVSPSLSPTVITSSSFYPSPSTTPTQSSIPSLSTVRVRASSLSVPSSSSSPTLTPTLTPTSQPSSTFLPSTPYSSSPSSSSSPTLTPTLQPSSSIFPSTSLSPSSSPTYLPWGASEIMVGAFYYPWTYNDFHRNEGYLRKILHQEPALGEYNDREVATIRQHLQWSRQANIRLLVTSWWGPRTRTDITTLDYLLPEVQKTDMKIALLYETQNRVPFDQNDYSNIKPDVEWMCEHYFGHPNYFRIQGRPAIVLYLSRGLALRDMLNETISIMRDTARTTCNENPFLVGDHAFQKFRNNGRQIELLDAITNYGIYGSLVDTNGVYRKGFVGKEGVTGYMIEQRNWIQQAANVGVGYVPCAIPGYNDRGVRLEVDHFPTSRQLDADSEHGTLFKELLRQGRDLVQPELGNLLLVNSFNEIHEDTQIEPVVGNSTSENFEYTKGFEYEGYDTRYLDILAEMTKGQVP